MSDLATLYRNIGDAYYALADRIDGKAAEVAPAAAPPALQALPAQKPQVYAPPPAPQPQMAGDIDIATVCPIHLSEYRVNARGKFCAHKATDPAWADRNGFCNLPGQDAKRALQWVAIQQGATR